VIRFSAGLVVVAIGVLIGGVATSKLSLVYVAIAVSAVALVALAIGVVLKRDELFGGGPGLAPAGAGAGSGMPVGQSADTGDVRGSAGHGREDQVKIRPTGPATAAFEAAAAATSKSAAAPTVAAPSATPPVTAPPVAAPPTVNPPLGQRQHAFSQASTRVDETVADWDTRPPQPPSSGDQGRPIWTPREQAPTRPSSKEPQSGSTGTPSAPARGWGSSADQPAPPSWFDRLNQPVADPATAEPSKADQAKAESAKTEPPKTEPPKTEPPKTESSKTESSKAEPFTAFAAKTSTPDADSSTTTPSASAASDVDTDDDDWPTRYSWLEDDETNEATGTADATDVTDAAETVAAHTVSPDTVPAKTVTEQAKTAEPTPTDADSPDAASPDPHPVTADDAIVTADSSAELAETPAVAAAHEDEDEDTDEPPAPQATGAKLVTVIPGVPRYHDPDCILIRFMDEDDIARKSIPEAKAANCTPCAACQPEG
jgi:hypothetical protein